MAQGQSRRSFLVDTINKSAGLWMALTGGVVLAAIPGCLAKYGGPGGLPETGEDAADGQADVPDDTGPVAKYGGPPDAVQDSADVPEDLGPVVKYGGPPSQDGG